MGITLGIDGKGRAEIPQNKVPKTSIDISIITKTQKVKISKLWVYIIRFKFNIKMFFRTNSIFSIGKFFFFGTIINN